MYDSMGMIDDKANTYMNHLTSPPTTPLRFSLHINFCFCYLFHSFLYEKKKSTQTLIIDKIALLDLQAGEKKNRGKNIRIYKRKKPR